MTTDAVQAEAERTALRIILSNVVAQLTVAHSSDPMEQRARLSQMSDECKLAAERSLNTVAGTDHREFVDQTLTTLNEFFKGITIT